MKKHLFNRLLSLVLAAVMVLGMFPAVSAAPANVSWKKSRAEITWDKTDRLAGGTLNTMDSHKPTDLVRVSIILEDAPTLKMGYSTQGIGSNDAARAYDRDLRKVQDTVAASISAQALDGKKLDVVWNLTLAANLISANVPYGKLDAIRAVEGVKKVVLENRYEAQTAAPEMYSSAGMVGSCAVWQTGMTGAGTRVAIVDTGTDTDHQSFDGDAYLYALAQNAAAKGMSQEEYIASLDLLDTAEIAAVLGDLNACERLGIENASEYYLNEKLPFGANYIDYDLNITHDYDNQGSHGSHVAGIAAANRFVEQNGNYVSAREAVYMNGVAPDAQIITLKVFGNGNGPFDSDYFAAIEDAIWLGCDSVNLSLGSGAPGYSNNTEFQELLEFMTTTDTVVVMSAGNSGYWAEETSSGYLYNDGVSFQTDGEPGSYTNTLAVASVDNDGTVGKYIDVAGRMILYTETEYSNRPISTLDKNGSGTEYGYIFIDGIGLSEDYAGMDLSGKVVFCHRGEISFVEKANNAAKLGAAAIVICNTADEPFGMDLTGYAYSTPCISVMLSDGAAIREASTKQTTAEGLTYYTGTVTISSKVGGAEYHSDFYKMSTFSSWGVPGSLELKPEITAPGGQIWSVNGVEKSGTAYELMSGTSMAAPQVTGMAALVAEYIQANDLAAKTGMSVRQLAQSLLMSTAVPMRDAESGSQYFSVFQQGAGLARVDLATTAESYITVFGQPDGKVKAELGDDPDRTGSYRVEFTIHNISGENMTYALNADVFTQDLFGDDYGNLYLDTWTRPLAAEVRFGSNGIYLEGAEEGFECDLNNDGITNAADADYLLAYLLGNGTELHANADLDGDGKATTYDAHLLLTKLTGGCNVEVPANGSVRVYAELELTEQTKEYLDAYYPTGAYIESYIYAAPVSNDEGVQGVTHSIPVLGYYGSWSEPSMYDVGSYVEYLAGAENRAPYLYNINNVRSNFVTVNYGDGNEYVFGGNPFVEEDEYLPERNAFNNCNGAMMQTLRFTQIRNADSAALVLSAPELGETIFFEDLGSIMGAYYHTNIGAWQNTQNRVPLGLYYTGIPEGTRLELSLITATEYDTYYDADDDAVYTAWDRLKEGAYLTTSFTIDNTAPVLKNIELEGNVLKVTAQDNEYIAAVALLNQNGTSMLTTVPGNQTERSAEITAELNMNGIFGEKFLLGVFDYAENQIFYEITLELDNTRPYFTAIDRTNANADNTISYVGMDADGNVVKLASNDGRDLARAAEYVEGAVFEITNDNKLYVAMDEDLFGFTYLCDLDPTGEWGEMGFCDLAYNKADGKLYGLFYSEKNDQVMPYLSTIDLYTGEMTVLGQMPIDANSIAIDGEGNFYSAIYGESMLYTYTADVTTTGKATFIGQTGSYNSTALNSMAWDHNTDELYWASTADSGTSLLKVDPETAAVELVASFDFAAVGLYIAYEPENDLFAPTDAVISVVMEDTAEILAGTSSQLTAKVMPWNISDPSVVWTTSDPGVVTVDEFGVITGVATGSAEVTATSVLDESKSATCTVTVTSLNKDLKGLVWDEEGQVHWASFNTDTIPAYKSLNTVDLPVNATMVADGKLYASTLDTSSGISDLYAVDPATFEMSKIGSASEGAYLDLTYGPHLGYGLATYFNYILLVNLETGDYDGVWDWSEGATSDLVGITYYGSEYNTRYGAWMDYFLILDTDGNVYLEAFMPYQGSFANFYGPENGYLRTIGDPVDYSYFQGFYFDGEYVYWTRFNEEDNVVELIVWDSENTGNVYSLGTFADGVWPVAGLYTDAEINGTNALVGEELATASVRNTEMLSTVPTVELTTAKGSLNAVGNTNPVVRPNSGTDNNDFTMTLDLTVTVPEEATNGILTIKYDADNLVCGGFAPLTDAQAHEIDEENGIVTIAFANREAIPADGGVAVVSFWSSDNVAATTEFTVTFTELNQDTGYFFEEKVEGETIHYCPSANFQDVKETDWFHDAVDFVVEKGWMNGLKETKFGPNDTMNRAQFVTVLYRMEGEPAVTNTGIFEDIANDQYYTNAVYWAKEVGITTGATESEFEPYGLLSRSQLVTFMYRYAKYKGYDVSAKADLSGFADAGKIQDYALAPWSWSVANGLVNGYNATTLAPMDLTNRSQAAAIFQRFAENIMN